MRVRLSPNLSMLWTDLPLAGRFERAAAAGFAAVELWWPGEAMALELQQLCRDAGVEVALLNVPAGDMGAGERGLASHPARAGEFRAGVDAALEAARGTGCHRFNALLGLWTAGVDPDAQLACARENLTWAADRAAAEGATILLEPVNVADNGPYLFPATDDVVDFIHALDRPNARLQADVYHMVRSGEDPLLMLERHFDLIGHVQIADAPGRGEPGTGAIDFDAVFALLEDRGYDGWVGLEYRPSTGDTGRSLEWLAARA
jgi:hydroxypyruvate isomerase